MRKVAYKIKWLSSYLIVISLLTVFWVWPAWNSGEQKWYWGNDGDTISKMYRNQHAPSGHNDPFKFSGDFTQTFLADEAAVQMLAFDGSPWPFRIEWDGMAPAGAMGTPGFNYSVEIGRWSPMTMMLEPFFWGSGMSGMSGAPIDGRAVSMMTVGPYLTFSPGQFLGAMVMFDMVVGEITVRLDETCYITSPVNDPGYPGWVPVPTLSRWGVLVSAVLVAFLSFAVIRRRQIASKR